VKETHVILILDRGFFSMDVFLLDKASFVIPARRNSKLYEEFLLRGIKCGKTGKEIEDERKATTSSRTSP